MKIKKLHLQIATGVLIFCLIVAGITLMKNKQKMTTLEQSYSEKLKKEQTKQNQLVTENKMLKTEVQAVKSNEQEKNSQNFDSISYQFIENYTTYATKNISNKRETLLKIANDTVVNKIVPEQQVADIASQLTSNKKDKNIYSSDLTFESKLLTSKIYRDVTGNDSCDYFALVTYEVSGASGKSEQQVMLEYALDKSVDGKIKVVSFDYHTSVN